MKKDKTPSMNQVFILFVSLITVCFSNCTFAQTSEIPNQDSKAQSKYAKSVINVLLSPDRSSLAELVMLEIEIEQVTPELAEFLVDLLQQTKLRGNQIILDNATSTASSALVAKWKSIEQNKDYDRYTYRSALRKINRFYAKGNKAVEYNAFLQAKLESFIKRAAKQCAVAVAKSGNLGFFNTLGEKGLEGLREAAKDTNNTNQLISQVRLKQWFGEQSPVGNLDSAQLLDDAKKQEFEPDNYLRIGIAIRKIKLRQLNQFLQARQKVSDSRTKNDTNSTNFYRKQIAEKDQKLQSASGKLSKLNATVELLTAKTQLISVLKKGSGNEAESLELAKGWSDLVTEANSLLNDDIQSEHLYPDIKKLFIIGSLIALRDSGLSAETTKQTGELATKMIESYTPKLIEIPTHRYPVNDCGPSSRETHQ